MAQSRIEGNMYIDGELSAKSIGLSAASVGNAEVKANAAISATKLEHQFPLVHQQAPGANIAAATQLLHICRAAETVVSIEAVVTGAAGGDRTASIDLQKSTGAGAFATILTAPLVVNSSLAVRTVLAGAIAAAGLVDGDVLQLVVTLGGASGTQPQGLLVTTTLRANPQ